MKNKMKFYLTIISLSSITLYGAEKPTEDKPSHQSKIEIVKQFKDPNLQKLDIARYFKHLTNQEIAIDTADTCIQLNELIPTDILQHLDPENLMIAHKHNERLREQLLQKKEVK